MLCKCGCGKEVVQKYSFYKASFIKGHNRRGAVFSTDSLLRIGLASSIRNRGKGNPMYGKNRPDTSKLFGSNNPSWKGDDVGYTQVHAWVRKHLPIPGLCQWTGCVEKPYYLANVTGIYSRDFHNWQYFCGRHHTEFDTANGSHKRDSRGRFVKNGY